MKKMILLFTFFVISSLLIAQKNKPSDWGLKKYAINDPKLGLIEYFIDTVGINKKAPVVIYLQGSEGVSLVFSFTSTLGNGEMQNFSESLMKKLEDKFHFIVISKPGTPFYDTLLCKTEGFEEILHKYLKNKVTEEYYNKISLTYRASVASTVIDKVFRDIKVDKDKIVIWGSSEGGMVCPFLANKNKKITHLVSEVGTGLNPFYMYINIIRERATKGELTYSQAQQKVDSLLLVYKEIVENPLSTDKQLFGFTYKYWGTHLTSGSIDNWLEVDIPMFIVAGAKDLNIPVACTDNVLLELIRNKKDITYRISAEGAHDLIGTRPYDDEIIKWIEK